MDQIDHGLLKEYDGKQQGAVPSEVLAGIIAEEARKIIMPFSRKDTPIKELFYSPASPGRFSKHNESEIKGDSLKDKHVLMVGAGALGNLVGIGLALEGVGILDVLDFDVVELTNLHRQILFYDAVGRKKARALASKIRAINRNTKANGLVGKLDEDFAAYFKENRPDLILDCVDNLSTRAVINYFAVKYKVPLVSGGTSHSSGQVVVYKPKESACLDCKLSVDKALVKERTSHSCILAAQPSVVMTNEIIGGLMVAEARTVLDPQNYGTPIKKMLKYDSTNPIRAGLVGSEAACECTRPGIKKWLKGIHEANK